jgi:hypothetical protein
VLLSLFRKIHRHRLPVYPAVYELHVAGLVDDGAKVLYRYAYIDKRL